MNKQIAENQLFVMIMQAIERQTLELKLAHFASDFRVDRLAAIKSKMYMERAPP